MSSFNTIIYYTVRITLMSVKQANSLCGYCALTLCKQCINLGAPCHTNDNGRTVCSYHAKNARTVEIDSKRFVVSRSLNFDSEQHNAYLQYVKNNIPQYPVFHSFYTDFNGSAHYSEIYDFDDVDLWKNCLPFSGVYLFASIEEAALAVSYLDYLVLAERFSSAVSSTIHTNGKVAYKICYQVFYLFSNNYILILV